MLLDSTIRAVMISALLWSWPIHAMAAGMVVSTGLCADQMAVLMVEPEQIAALSPQARDDRVSMISERVRALGVRVLDPSAEALFMTGADLVLTDPYGQTKSVALLKKLGLEIVRLDPISGLSDIPSAFEKTGLALNRMERGIDLARHSQSRLNDLDSYKPRKLEALYLRPDGGSAAAGTFIEDVLARAGYDSLPNRWGRSGWTSIDLETLVLDPPPIIVTSFFDDQGLGLRRSLARHPAFKQVAAHSTIIAIPGRMWTCDSWPLIDAAERLRAAHPLRGQP